MPQRQPVQTIYASSNFAAAPSRMLSTFLLTAALFLSAFVIPVTQARAGGPGLEFFEKNIRPVLVQHCYRCHSVDLEEPKGGLRLDSRAATRTGGDSGPAVVPGNVDESLLIEAIRHESIQMPPKEKLPDPVIQDFIRWIEMGAPDSRTDDGRPPGSFDLQGRAAQQWSLEPVRRPEVPAVETHDESRHPVDRFLRAKLESAGLVPAERADRRTLHRRLSFVLTGLPPRPEEVEAFVRDNSPDAYARLVDQLLISPHFGERWARHWMDVVRYGETHGFEWNYEVLFAWRYRDYLIRAFNQDVPFDQLVREHIAGDLLPEPRWDREEQINESVIGTAFYRFGEVAHDDCLAFKEIGLDVADNQIDTLTKAFQATTVSCARCHDHKLDAVTTKDYYALLGILQSSRQVTHTIDADAVNAEKKQRLLDLKTRIRTQLGALWGEEVQQVGRFLLAAQASLNQRPEAEVLRKGLDRARLENCKSALEAIRNADKLSLEDPLSPWVQLVQGVADRSKTNAAEGPQAKDAPSAGPSAEEPLSSPAFDHRWRQLAERYETEHRERVKFNDENFVAFGDFRSQGFDGWRTDGQAIRDGRVESGEFAVAGEGERAITGVFPAGFFSHVLSEKLNAALRSPLLPKDRKHVSLHVLGGKASAVRPIPDNCQLQVQNYHPLKEDVLSWVRLPTLGEHQNVRAYLELVTKFDNPKYPDPLGGMREVGVQEALDDPDSFFGVTHVVLHDCDESPRDELRPMRQLMSGEDVCCEDALAERYTEVLQKAFRSWAANHATDEDVRWIDWAVGKGLVTNYFRATPALAELIAEYRQVEEQLAVPRVVPGMADYGEGFDHPVFVGGDYNNPSETVPRRYVEVLAGSDGPDSPGSGRRELAELIASEKNPLTARVAVNRIWQHLFGTGIVRTPDDFGMMGELPSHPELLDYLAMRFMEEGWSQKKLIRLLVMTQAFQASSRPSPAAKQLDPENRLLSHYPARRLDAEAIRDTILAVSGRLDRKLYGPSIDPYRSTEKKKRRLYSGPLDGRGRRSIYTKVTLMEGPVFLTTFNFPDPKTTRGRRDRTNVPAQALALLNDPFVLGQAALWGERLVRGPHSSVGSRLGAMFLTAFGRPAGREELQRWEATAQALARLHQVEPNDVLASQAVWNDLAHVMFNTKEFIYLR